MPRSRVDELLEGWKMVSHSAERPIEAPRPRGSRSSLPLGLVAAAAIAIALIIALSARGSAPGPQPTLPAVGASPVSSASVAPSPSASVSASATNPSQPSPSTAPAGSGGTPTASDVSAARAAIDTYTADLVRGDYAAAWAMLGPEAQAHKGTLAGYSSERSAFFRNLGGRYTIVVSPTDVTPIASWLAGTYGAPIDLAHAVLVEVDYPALAGNNAGYDLFIVNPAAGGLKIYDVR